MSLIIKWYSFGIGSNKKNKNIMNTKLETLFDTFFNDALVYTNKIKYSELPKANVYSDNNELTIELFVAGYGKDELAIKVENNHLIVSSDLKDTKKETAYYEYLKSSFVRKFKIPTDADSTQVKAKHENGVLTIKLPYSKKKTESTIIIE